MTDKAGQRLERSFERVERRLPDRAARVLRWLRIPSGLLLIAGGVLSFLPVLGVWMLPLGFLLLAQDVPFLKGADGPGPALDRTPMGSMEEAAR